MKIRNGKNYFLWLLNKIDCKDVNLKDQMRVLELLYETEFTWILEHDSNRAAKGLNLRYEYNKDWNYGDTPCTVLEMMIALAYDWEHEITYDFRKGDRSSLWFWTMVKNLGLFQPPDISENHQIFGEAGEKLVVWLDRKFDEHGVGSPFPVKNSEKDQRKVEIWMQVQGFVLENVEI